MECQVTTCTFLLSLCNISFLNKKYESELSIMDSTLTIIKYCIKEYKNPVASGIFICPFPT